MNKRLKKYLGNKKPSPITNKQEVHNHPDNKIDQDFPGFPHGQSKENIIKPVTETEKKVATVDETDGEKMDSEAIDEAASDASGGAFDAAESVRE